MINSMVRWWRATKDRGRQMASTEQAHKSEVRLLEEQVKLRDLQIKNLVAENQRNYERIKSETAAFSADVIRSTNARS